MNGADYLLRVFENEGVLHIFMVPGMLLDPLVSSLGRIRKMTGVIACHEEGAVFMADGYAKVSRKFGVAASIGGPGITNMVTGIASAYSDGTPLFIISGETNPEWEGKGAFQDGSLGGINDSGIVAPITRKQLRINYPSTLKSHIDQLIRAMIAGPARGPVHLAISMDMQQGELQDEFKFPPSPSMLSYIDEKQCEQTWDLFRGARKIAILAGAGALHSGATDELVRFAEQYQIPVATTLSGKSVFPENHPLSLGVLGWYGNPYALETLLSQEIDVLIVLGSRFNQVNTAKWSPKLIPKKALILNDINPAASYGNYFPDLFVSGDAKEYLKALNEAPAIKKNLLLEHQAERKKWMEQIRATGPNYYDGENLTSDLIPIHPTRVMRELMKIAPSNTILFAGEGAHSFIASHYWKCTGPGQFFSQIKYIGAMEWSIAAAIGGKIANPNAPVVCITGDGCMLMHGLEIQTAARYKAAVIFVLMNNSAFGNPLLRAQKVGKFETEFLKLPTYNWAQIAEKLGVHGITVHRPEELAPSFEKAFSLNQPVLIDIRTGNYPTPTRISPF